MNPPPSQLDVLSDAWPRRLTCSPMICQAQPHAQPRCGRPRRQRWQQLALAASPQSGAASSVSQPAGQRGSGEHTQHERCHAADAQNGGRAPPKHWLSTLVAWNWPARPASGSNRAASRARASAASAQPRKSGALALFCPDFFSTAQAAVLRSIIGSEIAKNRFSRPQLQLQPLAA